MLLRKTIIIVPNGTTNVIEIKIYTMQDVPEPGYWNVETNNILLNTNMYFQFCRLKTQSEQKSFFEKLIKVSNQQLAIY